VGIAATQNNGRIPFRRGQEPPPEHKDCPFVKHEKCGPRALCNLIYLPLDPALSADYEAMFKRMKLRRYPK
jgi:hypothetical protein